MEGHAVIMKREVRMRNAAGTPALRSWRSARGFFAGACLALAGSIFASAAEERATVIVIAGAPGEQEFAPDFKVQVDGWAKVSEQAKAKYIAIGAGADRGQHESDREWVKRTF